MTKKNYTWRIWDLRWMASFVILVLLGAGIAYRQAPFFMPDEGAHYLRAYEVRHLHLVNFRGSVGVDIPCREYILAAQKYNPIPGIQEKAVIGQTDPACRVRTVNPVGIYSFIPYIPAAMALFITEKLNWQVENKLVAARTANFVAWFSVLFGGLMLLSQGRMLMACIILMPSFFWQMVALSSDGALLASCFLYVFLVLHIAQQGKNLTPKLMLAMVTTASLIGASKGVYAAVGLLSFALWDRLPEKGPVLKLVTLSAPALTALLTYGFLTMIADPTLVYIGDGANAAMQGALLIKDPLLIFDLTFRAIYDTDVMRLASPTYAIPNAGRAFGIMSASMLSMVVLLVYSDFGVNKSFRLVAAALTPIIFISFCLPIYLTYTPVGLQYIHGLQGRYYLPAIPLIFIALAFDASRLNAGRFLRYFHARSEWIVALSFLGLIVAYSNMP